MADEGYVYAHRKAWTHPAFKNLREAAVWNFLYQNAFWKDGERHFNGHTFQLKRGQIVVSISFLAKGFGMTDKGVRVVIQKLKKLKMVATKGASKGTIITICNYDEYQKKEKTEGRTGGNQRANRGQSKGDNKNEGNKGNEVNKYNIPENVWKDFIKHRMAKKAPVTETAMKRIESEAKNIGWTVEQALTEICARGWTGFKAEWIDAADHGVVQDKVSLDGFPEWKQKLSEHMKPEQIKQWLGDAELQGSQITVKTKFMRDYIKNHFEQPLCAILGDNVDIVTQEK